MIKKSVYTIVFFLCFFFIQVWTGIMANEEKVFSDFIELKTIVPALLLAIGIMWLSTYFLKKGDILDVN